MLRPIRQARCLALKPTSAVIIRSYGPWPGPDLANITRFRLFVGPNRLNPVQIQDLEPFIGRANIQVQLGVIHLHIFCYYYFSLSNLMSRWHSAFPCTRVPRGNSGQGPPTSLIRWVVDLMSPDPARAVTYPLSVSGIWELTVKPTFLVTM